MAAAEAAWHCQNWRTGVTASDCRSLLTGVGWVCEAGVSGSPVWAWVCGYELGKENSGGRVGSEGG